MSNSIKNEYHISAPFQSWCCCRAAPHLQKYFPKLSLIFIISQERLEVFWLSCCWSLQNELLSTSTNYSFLTFDGVLVIGICRKNEVLFCCHMVKLFKVWKSALPSWINIDLFGYCSSTSWPSMMKCSIDALLVFAKTLSWVPKQCETGDEG